MWTKACMYLVVLSCLFNSAIANATSEGYQIAPVAPGEYLSSTKLISPYKIKVRLENGSKRTVIRMDGREFPIDIEQVKTLKGVFHKSGKVEIYYKNQAIPCESI